MNAERIAGQLLLQVVAALVAAYILRALATRSPALADLGL